MPDDLQYLAARALLYLAAAAVGLLTVGRLLRAVTDSE